jgi:hypothetical protein
VLAQWVFGQHTMAVKIGWCPWGERGPHESSATYWGQAEILSITPKKLDTWDNSLSGFTKCPAFATYVSNTYMICSNIDIELTWDVEHKRLTSNLPPMAHDTFVHLHYQDFVPDVDPPIVSMLSSMLFVADQPVMIEMTPPYNHTDPAWRSMPGAFNIYNWFRPVIPSIEMLHNKVSIKRGQPLMYIRFKTENFKDNIVLERIERTDKLEHLVNSCLSVKNYQPSLSWKISNTFNPIRPRNLLKKCPFKRWL